MCFFVGGRSSVIDQFAEFHKTKWSFLQFLGTNCLKILLPLLPTPYLLQPCTHFSQYFCHMRRRRRRIHCMSISISIAISIQPIIIPFSIYLFLQDDFVEDCNSQLLCKTSSLKIATNNFCKTSSLKIASKSSYSRKTSNLKIDCNSELLQDTSLRINCNYGFS